MFLTPLIAAAIATAWGWRGSFIGLALPTILFGLIFYVLLGRKAQIEKKGHGAILGHKEESFAPVHFRRLVAFIFLSTSTWAVMLSVIAFIPLFIVDTFGVREETAAASLAIIYFTGLWACPLGGYLSDRLGSVPVLLVVCYAYGPLIYLLNILPFGLGFSALLFILGMLILMRAPLSEAYIISHAPERHRSTVLGIYFFSGLEGGGVLTPLMGFIIDKLGFYLSFTIAGVTVVALTLACSFYLWGLRE